MKPKFNSAMHCPTFKKPYIKIDPSEYSFYYESSDGTQFSSDSLTLKDLIIKNSSKDTKRLLLSYGEMVGHFMLNIYPHLNGFPGYDCITIKEIKYK